MLPKLRKISRKVFPPHTAPKHSWVGGALRLSCYKGKIPSSPLFAVIVSKRFYQNVVKRNQFKRRVFSIISEHDDFLKTLPYTHYVITPKGPIEHISLSVIKEDILLFCKEQKKS